MTELCAQDARHADGGSEGDLVTSIKVRGSANVCGYAFDTISFFKPDYMLRLTLT